MVDRSIRNLLLAVLLAGTVGLELELLLLEHAETKSQAIPHVALIIGLVSILAAYLRPSRVTLRVLRAVMIALIGTGVVGVFLHFRGNMEFVVERAPAAGTWALVWKSLRGATPALAPGAIAQLGLLGILYTYRHPLLAAGLNDASTDER